MIPRSLPKEKQSSSSASAFSSSQFDRLPFDLLAISLSFLHYRELARSSIRINRFFHDAAIQSFRIYTKELLESSKQLATGFDVLINRDYFSSC